ncbi:sugar ABC transporter permease [Isoptericola sp. NEAU-Y5]|uniref:Xylose transport system permease protein XylH n=1 Tax=Isoptericola luteus TaxID=2879484 RepID=A0ABS7ZBZ3_9MICO|nr:multiple monosaccharide ABC transporter permease [Isoptericola sp. NEAU-Y5]MCA5892545.1 sugar ABC transporter permease [Isoptericola sp. NEAU-Y5]
MNAIDSVRDILTRNMRQSGIVIAFIAISVLFAVLNPNFLSPGNLTNIVLQYSYILILAIGMVMIIVAGQIDLSVGSVVALTGAVSAVVVVRNGMPWYVGVIAALVVGALVGVWQGFWVAYVGIPGFIVTLAGMLLFRGLTFLVLDNASLSPFGGIYQDIANGFLNGLLGGYGFDVFTLVVFAIGVVGYAIGQWRTRQGKIAYQQTVESMPLFVVKLLAVAALVMWFGYQLSISRGLPVVLIILAVLIIAYTLITQKSVFGRHVYAVGGNVHAAELSGVKVKKINFWIFVNMGVLASVAGIVYSSRMNGAQPGAGNMFELDAIAACFIGGASTTGGVGRVGGAMIGGLIMAVMSNGMQLMGVPQSMQQVVKGLVLLLAVAFDIYNKRRASVAR